MKINQVYPLGISDKQPPNTPVNTQSPNNIKSPPEISLSNTDLLPDALHQMKIYLIYLYNKGLSIESQESFLEHNRGKYNVLFLAAVKDYFKFKTKYDKIVKGKTVEEIKEMSSEDIMQFFDEPVFK